MDARSFERNAAKRIKEFTEGKKTTPPTAYAPTGKLKVTLKVRMKRIAKDEFFSLTVDTLSELQAEMETRKAARLAGWPIIAYVQEVVKV